VEPVYSAVLQAHKTLRVAMAEEEILLLLSVLTAIFQVTWVSWYQNVSILDIIGAKDDGGDDWSYKTCKAPVKLSPPTNQHPVFLQARCPSCHPTNSVTALKEGKEIFYMFKFTNSSITLHSQYITY